MSDGVGRAGQKRKGNKKMITKNETHEPRKILGLYRHDSGLKINYYEGDKKESGV